MVGVPGRSKACHTCKRRKKGCDRQKPFCGQCSCAGIPCEGYENTLIFVNSGLNKQGFMPKSYATQGPAQPKTHILKRKESFPIKQDGLLEIDQCLGLAALQTQCFDNFWSSLLPNGQMFSGQATLYSTAGWFSVALELCQKDGPVRLALLANALGMLGAQSGQRSLIVEGWRAYGRALKVLAQSLPAVNEEKGDELLTTSTLLCQFELSQGVRSQRSTSTSGERWIRHTSGEEAIILARTPECFVDGHAHRLFIDSRLHLIFPYLQNRKRSPFSSLEWKEIPWSLSAKDPKNELLDILIEIPGIQEDLDKLLDFPYDDVEIQISSLQVLEQSFWHLDSQLQQWSVTSGFSTISFVESQVSSGDQESSPSSEDFAMAHLGLLYWTTCIILYRNLGHISRYIQAYENPCHTSRYKHAKLPARMEPRRYCRKVMMLSPYFQHPNIGEFFMNIVAFPTIVVMKFLDELDLPDTPSEERKMFLKMFRGKYRQQMQHFLGAWPWRNAKSKRISSR